MEIKFNTYSPISNKGNVVNFQSKNIKPIVGKVSQNLNIENNIVNTKNFGIQSFIDKIKIFFGFANKRNVAAETENLVSEIEIKQPKIKDLKATKPENLIQKTEIVQPKIKDLKAELKNTELEIRNINKRIKTLNGEITRWTKDIQEFETRDNGTPEVWYTNWELANFHTYTCQIGIEKNNKELIQLKDQRSQLRNKINTINNQIQEIKNNQAK